MKFCKDCVYCSNNGKECRHPTATFEVDTAKYLVTGNPADTSHTEYYCCHTMRDSQRRCGEQAKYWVGVNMQGSQPALLPGPDPVVVKPAQTIWGRVWSWILPAAVIAALWLMWWVAVQFTD